MVLEELKQVARRIVLRLRRRRGPHRSHDRCHEMGPEICGIAAAVEEVAQRRLGCAGIDLGGAQQPLGLTMKPLDLAEHAQESNPAQRTRLREEAPDAAGARVLQAASITADRHAHVRLLSLDPELPEQPQQGGVGAPVVHDEPVSTASRRPALSVTSWVSA